MKRIDRFEMYDRVTSGSDWKLFIHDYYWVLVMDDYYEFYYNPSMYLGKIKAKNMPNEAIARMHSSCRVFTPEDRDTDKRDHFGRKDWNIRSIANMPMKSGNTFYAMGAWCATSKRQFFFQDPYTLEIIVCGIKEMSWFSADCMMRMAAWTKTEEYFPDIPSLGCFRGMNIADLIE